MGSGKSQALTEEDSVGGVAGGKGRFGERVLVVIDGDSSKVVLLDGEGEVGEL